MNALLTTTQSKIIGLIFAIGICLLCMVSSVMFGVKTYAWDMIRDAYLHFNGTTEHLIIKTARMPRALIAATVGASLAVAGAFMQAITRNPLASPSLFGVNAGAAFAIVLTVAY